MPRRLALLALLLVAGVALLAGCAGDAEQEGSAEDVTSTAEPGATDPGGPVSCDEVEAPTPRGDGEGQAPSERLDPERTYRLVFDTSCGTFTITLDQATAPATASSLVALTRDGFFDETVFHRIVPGFVIQGGDPTQTGSGGPGYSTVDVPPADAAYVKGVVAMAKTQTEPPGTSGSQFFVVTGADVGLPAEYAIVGTVTDGLAVVEAIDALGDPDTELPLQPVVVRTVSVDESA
jgi:peptidyl-prolyl cis-trans isomerase B (cyclophilin B)